MNETEKSETYLDARESPALYNGRDSMRESLPRGRPTASIDPTAPYPNRIRELRLSKNLSQRELGKLVGLSQSQLGAVERGRYRPSSAILERLGRVLGVAAWHIFFQRGPDPQRHQAIIETFEGLSPEHQKTFLDFLDVLSTHRRGTQVVTKRPQGKSQERRPKPARTG